MKEPRTRWYRDGRLAHEGFPMANVSDHLEEKDGIVWVDMCAPSAEELQALADELGLHELAIEDALGPHQRPKLDDYGDHLFLAVHAIGSGAEPGTLVVTEIDAFINPRFLITVRKDDGFDMAPVLQRWDRSSPLAEHGVGYLLYALLDHLVDGYFDVIQALDDYYDEVAEELFAEQPKPIHDQRNWFRMRRSLVTFHRLVLPLRETVNSLARRDYKAIPPELDPYFQDIHDHVLRISESTESLRDLVSTIVETDLSLRGYQQNQVMKKVTSWAAIIAVPTLVTGYYGMNVPYPGSGETWGVVTASVLSLGLSGLLYVLFRRRDWL